MQKAKKGIWTPHAKVICFECHGNEFPRKSYDLASDEWKQNITPTELIEDNAITKCCECGTEIQIEEGIAYEHNLVLKLRENGFDACMEQTGGMCDAMTLYRNDGGGYMVTYDFYDGDERQFIVGKYDETEDGEWNFDEASHIEFKTFDETYNYLASISDAKKLEVVQNGREEA